MKTNFPLRKVLAIALMSFCFVPATAFGANSNEHADGRHVQDAIVNGDFQYPSNETILSVNPMATFRNSYNISPDTGCTNTKIDWEGTTIAIPGFDKSKFGWRSTQTLTEPGVIEIQHRDRKDESNLYVELCAFEGGTAIYQDIKTVDDSIYRWTLRHSALNSKYVDKMKVLIGPVGDEQVSPATRIASDSGQQIGETSDVIASINRNTDGDKKNPTPSPSWNTYTGAVYIPSGQTTTRFTFESADTKDAAHGNLIDDISFEVAYPLYYDTNGGDGIIPLPSDNDYSGYHACGDDVKLLSDNVPTKPGCVFIGWSQERLDTIHNQSEYESVKDKITADVTFGDSAITMYAVYETVPFNVTFVDGHTGNVITTQKVRKNGNASFPAIPNHDGYVINGWDSDGKNITEDVTITVNYSPIAYTILFDKNSEEASGEMGEQYMTYDVSSPLNANRFVRNGYSFIGWCEREDGHGVYYADREDVINLTSKNGVRVTLYAQWLKHDDISIIYNVRSDDGKGDSTVSNSIEAIEDDSTNPSGSTAVPSDEYDFVAWLDENGDIVSNNMSFIPQRPSRNIVYTAYFKRKELNVRFIDSDGTVLKEEKVKYGDSAVAPDNPCHDNYRFTNWDKAFDYIIKDTDIYAMYVKNDSSNIQDNDDNNDMKNISNSSSNNISADLIGNATDNDINTGSMNSNRNNNVLVQTGVYMNTIPIIMVLSLIIVWYCKYMKKK